MTTRQKLKSYGLDYHKIAEFFGYNSNTFSATSSRNRIEEGVLKVVEHIKAMEDQGTQEPEI